MFRDERACFDFIIQSRWTEDNDCVCPSCWGRKCYAPKDRLVLVCASCKHLQSATAGTVMHRSKISLCSWLLAAWLMVTDKRGVSARQLERQLGVSYEAAFGMLHKLRAAMVSPQRTLLTGRVEVDETFVGGPVPGKRGRGTAGPEGKAIVLGAVEVRKRTDEETGEVGTYPARIRLRHVEDFGGGTCLGFVGDVVEPGATVVTDDSRSYDGLPKAGYRRKILSAAHGDPQDSVLPHFHLAASNLKTWLLGTHHGAVSQKHLQAYLNEFTYRFNRRRNLYAAFQTILGIAGRVEGPTQESLYAEGPGKFAHPNRRVRR